MEALVLAFFFGLSAAVIGKIKGSSFFLWLLIGFCLPGFGIIAAIVYRYDRHERLRECPECGNVAKLHDQVCTRCGRDLFFPEHEPIPASSSTEDGSPSSGDGPSSSEDGPSSGEDGPTSSEDRQERLFDA